MLVAILPGVALLGYAAVEADRRVRDEVRAEAGRTVQLLAQEQARSIDSARGLLAGLSRIYSLAALVDPARCSAMLADIAAESTFFNNLSLLDPSGRVVCSAAAPQQGLVVSDRKHFRRAVETRAFAVGEFLVARINGLPTFYSAAPVLGRDGSLVGVATAGLDLAALQRRLDAQALPAGAAAVVTDENGIVLARRPRAGAGEPVDDALGPSMRAGADGAGDLAGPDGALRSWAWRPVPGPGGRPAMLVAVGLPFDAPRAQLHAVFERVFLGFGALALVLAGVALGMGEVFFVRRMGRIIATARRLARGDLAARTGLDAGPGEMGTLSRSIDEMARSIEVLSRQNRLILDAAGDGILGVDPARRITFANPAAARALGRTPGDLLGRSLAEVASAEVLAELDAGAAAARDGAPPDAARRTSGPFLRAGGARFHAEFVATRLREGGDDLGSVIAFRDVSDRLRLEEQLRHAQKMDAVGQLAGGVAHDFNNLLTAILSFGRFVRSDLGEGHPSGGDVDEILRAAERAAALTRQLLAFSRRQVLEPRVIDLGETVAGLEKMLRRLIGENITLETRVAPSVGRVRVDPGHVEQVIVNLAVNARDAMPSGGRLQIEVAPATADEIAALQAPPAADGLVRLSIADTGVGMDRGTLAHIFEPFFTTKPAGRGTGLGLSTVYGIVTQSGGALRVASEPGRGTTFHVYLPRSADRGEEAPAGDPAGPVTGTETVLLVEDDAAVRSLAARVLAGGGYRVLEAGRPREAIDLVMGFPERVHLLLTDVILPEMRGPALAKHLLGVRPGVRVLYTSGYTGGQLAAEDLTAAGHAFLPKPFTPEALLRKVREVLDAGARPEPGAEAASAPDAERRTAA